MCVWFKNQDTLIEQSKSLIQVEQTQSCYCNKTFTYRIIMKVKLQCKQSDMELFISKNGENIHRSAAQKHNANLSWLPGLSAVNTRANSTN